MQRHFKTLQAITCCKLYIYLRCPFCRYPFVLSKSSMYSVGAPHTWPMALGALMWLIDNVKVKKNVFRNVSIRLSIFLKTKLCFLPLSDPGEFEWSQDVYHRVLWWPPRRWWRHWLQQGVVLNTNNISNISMLFSQYEISNIFLFVFFSRVCSFSRTTQPSRTTSSCTIMTHLRKKMKLSPLNSVSTAHLFRNSHLLFFLVLFLLCF